MKKFFVLLVALTFMVTGCASTREQMQEKKKTTRGALAGAVLGAAVGGAVGGDAKGAAIGATVGALAGGGIGYMMDKQEEEFRSALAESEAASIERVKQAEAEVQEAIIVTFKSDMWFDIGSAELKPGGYSEIDRVATVLNKYPQTNIRIEGHTDSTGDEAFNLNLSEQRGNAVKNALVAKNVDPSRMNIVPFGESKPIAGNDTPEGRQQNRRVSIVVVPVEA
jgi:outer membrane protein OmpA-like peptidoglycan-associated protein